MSTKAVINNFKDKSFGINDINRIAVIDRLQSNANYHQNHYQSLVCALQITLDTQELLNVFLQEMRLLMGVEGVSYQNQDEAVSHHIGVYHEHRYDYHISVEDQELGTLSCYRRHPFIGQELNMLEYLISAIAYPMRNCLLYTNSQRHARIDTLTGVGSRSAMNAAMDREFCIAERQAWPLSLLIVDIDLFKRINDTYGHSAGDHVLAEIAKTLKDCLRKSDECFRYGGEEFVLMLSKTDAAHAGEIAERIRTAIEACEVEFQGNKLNCTVSIGVCETIHGESSQSAFDRADQALYLAKQSGRNQVQYSA